MVPGLVGRDGKKTIGRTQLSHPVHGGKNKAKRMRDRKKMLSLVRMEIRFAFMLRMDDRMSFLCFSFTFTSSDSFTAVLQYLQGCFFSI